MAGYGQFTGYEPGPAPGTFSFQTQGGQPFVFGGPQAEELKARLDATASMQPKLAQMSTGPAESMPDANGGMSAMPPQAPAAQAPEAAAPAAPAAPANPLAGFNPSHMTASGDTVFVHPETGEVRVNRRARAGSKGGLVERSRTVQGGYKPDEEYLAGTEANFQRQAEAQMVGEEAANEQASMERAYLEKQQQNLAEQAAEQQAQHDQIKSRVGELQLKYDAAEKAYSSSTVDPMAGRNPNIDSMVSGLGVVGALLNKSPNYTQQILDQEIQKNIRRQEAELQIKGDSRDNLLGRLKNELGSLDLAKSALYGMQVQQAKNEFSKIAATTGDKARQAVALQNAAKLDQQYLDFRNDYMQRAEGVVTRSIVNAPGSAGSRGGVGLATQAELAGAREIQGKEAGITSTNTNTAKTMAELEKGDGGGKPKASGQKRLGEIDSARQGVLRMKEKWIKAGKPGVLRTGYGSSDTSQDLAASVDALAPGLGRALEGNAPNESTMAGIRGGMLSASGDKIGYAFDAYLQQLDDMAASVKANPNADWSSNPPKGDQ
jgi:hypothetical protein